MRFKFFTAILVIFFFVNVFPQVDSENIVIGKKIKLHSKVLNEDRDIYIHTPNDYETSAESYPVLYILDGEEPFYYAAAIIKYRSIYRMCPQIIIVGIPNTDRNRDLTPTHSEKDGMGRKVDWLKTSGGADNMLKFINEELFPYVEKNYRTIPFRILSGHSFGGLFVLHTFLSFTNLFNAYMAISTSFWYDDKVLIKRAEDLLGNLNCKNKFLYFTVGGEEHEMMLEGNQKFSRMLKEKNPEGLLWKYDILLNETHVSQAIGAFDKGIDFFYEDWSISYEKVLNGLSEIKDHYSFLSEKYGYEVKIPENYLNSYGGWMMRENLTEKAVELYKYYVEKYPESPNAYFKLGEAYEKAEDFNAAKKYYGLACEKGEAVSDPNLEMYKEKLKKLKK